MELTLGLTKAMLHRMSEREKFSSYLPYLAYEPEKQIYHNADGSQGFIFECVPLWFSNEARVRTLTGLFRVDLPLGSVMQVILYADPYVTPLVDRFRALHKTKNPLINRSMEEYAKFLKDGVHGFRDLAGIPARNFRLFVSVYVPGEKCANLDIKDVRIRIREVLDGAGLAPANMDPTNLIRTLWRIFNDDFSENVSYNDTQEIRKQIISSETVIENEMSRLKLGSKVARTVTPKNYPKESSILTANILTGDIWGVQSDGNQIRSPFIITYNIIFDNVKSSVERRAAVVLHQQALGSLAPSLMRRKEEFNWAMDLIAEAEERFMRVVPVVTVFGDDDDKTRDSTARVKRLWEDYGFVMQEDKGIIPILFLSSLPFGLYNTGDNVKTLDRDFIMPSSALAEMLPVQADFQGSGTDPRIIFIGRKGELSAIDLFDKRAGNMNALIAASSGSGKSFLMNHIIVPNLASGAYVRIIDVGRSYKKICNLFDGKFIEFTEDSNICLNPFTNIFAEEINHELYAITKIILQMIYSFTDESSSETEASLVKAAVRWAYEKEGREADINTVYDGLVNYYKSIRENYGEEACLNNLGVRDLEASATKLSFNLKEFTRDGAYGRWFCGKANLNVKEDQFVVLELEELQTRKELFKVVVLQVLNYITQDLYLSDRGDPRMVIFDEAWQFFKMGGFLLDIIEEGDRRARKYKGSFTKVIQSLMDLDRFRDIGNVLFNNSAFRFYPQSDDYEKAVDAKIIDCSSMKLKMLKSVRLNRPKYSELYVETPMGEGVVRLMVNSFLYFLYTSDADDNVRLDKLIKGGKSPLEAVEMLAREMDEKKKEM